MAPAAEPQPKGPAQPDYGSIASRWSQAGIDLEKDDPTTIARARALASRVGEQPIYTQNELPGILAAWVSRAKTDPQARQWLAAQIEAKLEDQRERAAESMDPEDQRVLKLMEKVIGPHLRRLDQLEQFAGSQVQMTEAQKTEQAAAAKVQELYNYFGQAQESVPGARNHPEMERWFNLAIRAMEFPPENVHPVAVRQWVENYVKERQGSGRPRAAAPVGARRGGALAEKDLDKLTANDVQKALEEMLSQG